MNCGRLASVLGEVPPLESPGYSSWVFERQQQRFGGGRVLGSAFIPGYWCACGGLLGKIMHLIGNSSLCMVELVECYMLACCCIFWFQIMLL